jgi:Caspase domain/Agenet domain
MSGLSRRKFTKLMFNAAACGGIINLAHGWLVGMQATEPQRDWTATKTWVFAVGLLEWKHPDVWAPFPDAVEGRFDAKLVEFFRSQGVPDEQIVYLQDRAATLKAIQTNFTQFLAKTNPDDLLIFYFAGHGDWDGDSGTHYFINYDANAEDRDNYWSVSSIFDEIEQNFQGSQVLLLADCCYSGGLIDEVKQRNSKIDYACVTSAYSHNASTGEWTFTKSLYKGLQGDPRVDKDSDRVISLYDFARYAELEMAFIEEQKSMFYTSPNFNRNMRLAQVRGTAQPDLNKHIEVQYKGDWYKAKILASNNGRFQVRYIGYDWEPEWVENNRIRPYNPKMFTVGDKVEVESEEKWYPATVKQAWYGLHFVSYDDFSANWNEWVGSDRIRPR